MDSADREALLADRAAAYGYVRLWWIQALRKSGASVMARDVLTVIASYADKSGNAWPGVAKIAALLSVSEKAVKAAARELVDAGVMTSTRRNSKAGEANLLHLAAHDPRLLVTPVVTKTACNEVTPAGAVNEPFRSPDRDAFISPDPCSNRASNVPTKIPTNERASKKSKNGDDERFERLVSLIAECGYNGQASTEARKVLRQVDGDIDRLIGWLSYAVGASGIKNPAGFAIRQTKDGVDPPHRAQVNYPVIGELPPSMTPEERRQEARQMLLEELRGCSSDDETAENKLAEVEGRTDREGRPLSLHSVRLHLRYALSANIEMPLEYAIDQTTAGRIPKAPIAPGAPDVTVRV